MAVSHKIIKIKCPKCQLLLNIKIEGSTIAGAKSLPTAVSFIHGDPVHTATIWVDSEFVVRAVEAPETTLVSQGVSLRAARLDSAPAQESVVTESAYEDRITDEVTERLMKALETVGRMSAEVVLEISRAQEEVNRLSALHRGRREERKPAPPPEPVREKLKMVRKAPRAPGDQSVAHKETP